MESDTKIKLLDVFVCIVIVPSNIKINVEKDTDNHLQKEMKVIFFVCYYFGVYYTDFMSSQMSEGVLSWF